MQTATTTATTALVLILLGAVSIETSLANSRRDGDVDLGPSSRSSAPQRVELTDSIERFAGLAGMLNEIEDRRRRVVHTPYPSSADQGVIHGFVHMGSGAVAFARTDLVVNASQPIVIRRAYSSLRDGKAGFGAAGWVLTLEETITPNSGGGFTYRYGNNLGLQLDSAGRVRPEWLASTVDVLEARIQAHRRARVVMRSGVIKNFTWEKNRFRLHRIDGPRGGRLRFEYAHGVLAAVRADDGPSAFLSRDQEGRITRISDSLGRHVDYRYGFDGRLAEVTGPGGHPWHYRYDGRGLLAVVLSPLGYADLEFAYDRRRAATGALVNGYRNTYRFDGLRSTVTDHADRTTVVESAPSGMTRSVTNWLGTITHLSVDAKGRPAVLRRDGEILSRTQYGVAGSSLLPTRQQISAPGRPDEVTTIEYDRHGRVTAMVGAENESSYIVTDYGAGLVPRSVAFADGSRSRVAIDPNGRLTRFSRRGAAPIKMAWDGANAEVSSEGRTATLRFAPAGHLVEVTLPDGRNANFEFATGGLRSSTSTSDGIEIGYHYDPSGALVYTETGKGESVPDTFSYEIDSAQQLRAIRGTGVSGYHEFSYTNAGRVLRIESSVINDMSFLYDDAGRLETVVATGLPPLSYRYAEGEPDLVAQLDSRTSAVFGQQYEVDDYGDRFSVFLTRTRPSALGTISYDDRVGELRPAIDPQRWTPHEAVDVAVANTKLEALFAADGTELASFSMPSNRFFVPAEFWSVNCCFCCPTDELFCFSP